MAQRARRIPAVTGVGARVALVAVDKVVTGDDVERVGEGDGLSLGGAQPGVERILRVTGRVAGEGSLEGEANLTVRVGADQVSERFGIGEARRACLGEDHRRVRAGADRHGDGCCGRIADRVSEATEEAGPE